MPPHIYAISESAYRCMLQGKSSYLQSTTLTENTTLLHFKMSLNVRVLLLRMSVWLELFFFSFFVSALKGHISSQYVQCQSRDGIISIISCDF